MMDAAFQNFQNELGKKKENSPWKLSKVWETFDLLNGIMSGKERKEAMKKWGKRGRLRFFFLEEEKLSEQGDSSFESWKKKRGNRIPKERKTINFFFFYDSDPVTEG